MCGKASPVQHGRRLTFCAIALPAVVLVLWLAGVVPFGPVFPVALLGFVALAVMDVALVADTVRLPAQMGGRLLDPPSRTRTRVLIVGAGPSARRAAEELERGGEHEVVGFVTDGDLTESGGFSLLGTTRDIPQLVRRLEVQQVVVAEAPSWQRQLAQMMTAENRASVGVHIVPGYYEARMAKLQFHRVRDLPLVDLTPSERSKVGMAVKRGLDLILAAVGLVVTAPVMALAALAVKLTSSGPVLFRQERVGMGGRRFTILKLRTMVVDAEKNTGPCLSAGKSDPRITPVGKLLRATRIDELPQLLNVLKGEMSIVGPRPERPCFVGRYEAEISSYRERHQVRPGVTGLAQVNGGYAIDAEMKLRYDLMYIYNCSLWLDLKIVLQTVTTVFRRTGQ